MPNTIYYKISKECEDVERRSQEYVKSTICNLYVCLSYFLIPSYFHTSYVNMYVNEKDCFDSHNFYCVPFLLCAAIATNHKEEK